MRPLPLARQLPPPLAVLLALMLHAALLALAGSASRPAQPPLVFDVVAAELSLPDDVPLPAPAAPDGAPSPVAPPREATGTRAGAVAALTLPPRAAVPSGDQKVAGAAGSGNDDLRPPPRSPGGTPRAIDLGLNDGVRQAALLGGWVELPAASSRPSDGGLRQALAARDAERGLSRSSAATHAAYQAARHFAPRTGIGTFDITADERGVVLSVTLASAPTNEHDWQRVGEELQQLLKERRLRVPPGARGLVARLRIETGELAQDNAERFRTKRAPALGQAPSRPRELRAESTRNSLEPGQLSPTLGITIAGGGGRGNIRVVLVDERAL